MSSYRLLARAAGFTVGACLITMLGSCGRDAGIAPTDQGVKLVRHGLLSIEPVFPRLVSGNSLESVVQFEKVRVVLHRADGSVALDTLVLFPVGADSVVLAASVPLSPSTGNGGENFKLDLGYTNVAGEVVFKGGPVDLTVVPKGSNTTPAPVQIPIKYSGAGAEAKNVVISPRAVSVSEGQSFAFSAVAIDAAGTVIPNTPIIWATPDPLRVTLNSSTSGDGRALAVRGTARVLAQLLTGPVDTVTVTVSLLARNIALQSGDGQKGIVGGVLPLPIAVKVTASDGAGVAGVAVAFAAATGSGSTGSTSVLTDASGVASTSWTLGSRPGEHTVTATVPSLVGSPVTFKASARSVAPVKLVVTTAPATSNVAGSSLPIIITALDAQGDVAKSFTGPVTLTLGATSPVAPLLGTLTVNAVAGVASFTDVRINRPGTGYTLAASASDLQGAETSSFSIVPGPAERLEFGEYPVNGGVAGALEPVLVIARDAVGNVATGFTGVVTLTLLDREVELLGGTRSRPAVAGTASFSDLTLNFIGDYRIRASAAGLTATSGRSFFMRAGPATQLYVVAGGDQTATTGTTLPVKVTVNIADQYGNPVATSGITVNFVASHGGSASPASATTNANGYVSTQWTVGGTSGTQTLTASGAALSSASVSAVVTAPTTTPTSGGGEMIVLEDWNWGDNSYGLSGSYPGNQKFVKNLVSFTPSGTRATAKKVVTLLDRSIYPTMSGAFSNFATAVSGAGLTPIETSSHAVLTPVASDVKVIILMAPGSAFTTAEINGLKTFASQGGRIVFVGENSGTYGYQSSVENPFLIAMGAAVRSQSSPSCLAPGVIVTTASHTVTTGITATGSDGFYMNCTSYLTGLGANDLALFTLGGYTLGAVVSISYTPVTQSALRAMLRNSALVEPSNTATAVQAAPDGSARRSLRRP